MKLLLEMNNHLNEVYLDGDLPKKLSVVGASAFARAKTRLFAASTSLQILSSPRDI